MTSKIVIVLFWFSLISSFELHRLLILRFPCKLHSCWTLALFVLFTAAERVISRQHILKKNPVHVKLCTPFLQCRDRAPLTVFTSEGGSAPPALACYKDRVLVSGVPPETTTDCLLNYLECVTDASVITITRKKDNSVLVIMESSKEELGMYFHSMYFNITCHPQ